MTCNPIPYWPRVDSDGSAAESCPASQPTCAGNLQFTRNLSAAVASTGPLAVTDSYNDCRCSPNVTYPTDTSACTHYELISTTMCEFTTGNRQFACLLLTDALFRPLTIFCLAVTEENTWQWLSVETSTPEECMHEVLKRDSSSGVMEREDGIAVPDWQGCSHRCVPTRECGGPLAYYFCLFWQSGEWRCTRKGDWQHYAELLHLM